ncbi:46 kDa FK506-binding nuclear protein-like [Sitodiplosis mosellana]|uniref:46 kDa FK506-binding nuclear protein-like n=1 Tax=Sitodiplosis mosellana TaxID=263140 RepID=UPI0024439FBD|nr:46 kDa FK506-binding nuclear protein-like [Sitodiplosis mosellana]
MSENVSYKPVKQLFQSFVLEPNSNICESVDSTLHLTQAVLDLSSMKKTQDANTQVWVGPAEKQSLIASLGRQMPHVTLDLMFGTGEKLNMSTKGAGKIYISGYFMPNDCYETIDISVEEPHPNPTDFEPNTIDEHKQRAVKKEAKINTDSEKVLSESESGSQIRLLTNGVKITDAQLGDGRKAKRGKAVFINYDAKVFGTDKRFAEDKSELGCKITLGGEEQVEGLQTGIIGMRVGGKRNIICPPQMAYGSVGVPGLIPKNATIVYNVELISVG